MARPASARRGAPGLPSASGSGMRWMTASCCRPMAWLATMSATGIAGQLGPGPQQLLVLLLGSSRPLRPRAARRPRRGGPPGPGLGAPIRAAVGFVLA